MATHRADRTNDGGNNSADHDRETATETESHTVTVS